MCSLWRALGFYPVFIPGGIFLFWWWIMFLGKLFLFAWHLICLAQSEQDLYEKSNSLTVLFKNAFLILDSNILPLKTSQLFNVKLFSVKF